MISVAKLLLAWSSSGPGRRARPVPSWPGAARWGCRRSRWRPRIGGAFSSARRAPPASPTIRRASCPVHPVITEASLVGFQWPDPFTRLNDAGTLGIGTSAEAPSSGGGTCIFSSARRMS